MFKHIINPTLRGLALLGLFLSLVGAALLTPSSASAASCDPRSGMPVACSQLTVDVFDAFDGSQISNAKVTVTDGYGNTYYATNTSNRVGYYLYLTPGEYKVTVVAPAYSQYTTAAIIEAGQASTIKAPLIENSRRSPKVSPSISKSHPVSN